MEEIPDALTTFAIVKGFVKYILVVLTLCGYLISNLELNSKECKQNYSKENKTYICSAKSFAANSTQFDLIADLPVPNFSDRFAAQVIQQTCTFQFGNDSDPPERLYLRYSVFLI